MIDIMHSSKEPGAITQSLCRVQARDTWVEEATENARLIAAAPDMLAALRSAHHMLTRDYIDDAKMAVIEKCDAAIQKATGEA